MADGGPVEFAQPLYADPPILDGVALPEAFATTRTPQRGHVNILGTADLGSIVQVSYRGAITPLASAYYQWGWAQRASDESGWLTVGGVISRGRPVWWVPHDTVIESFISAEGATTFTLGRFLAEAKEPLFDTVSFPHVVLLNGVIQTIVPSSPSAGEVSLSGKTVTTPALVVGDVLEVRYYPAYAVIMLPATQALAAFNLLNRPIIALETPLQEPS